jgi:hypothetical protein
MSTNEKGNSKSFQVLAKLAESQVSRGFRRWNDQLGGRDSIRAFNEMLKPFGLWLIVEKIYGEMWVKLEKKP